MKLFSDLEQKAYLFAKQYHRDQKYGEHPYTYHLGAVVNILESAGLQSDEWTCAGWLHDVVEDTIATHAMVRAEFNEEVHRLVYCVTGHGRNRKERNADIYDKLDEYPPARNLKLADRIANVEHSINSGNVDKFSMYYQEHLTFFSHVKEGSNEELKRRYLEAIEQGKNKGLVCD
jgi:(p)ppGpp synthase/HD superfamily hydrolase